jgi:CheY-like chemotaxis protein
VILLDLKMPRRGGLEVLQYLRQHPELKVIPTIVFTSSREAADIERAYDLGANAFMVKPHDFDGLVSVMRKVREFWDASEKPKPKQAG